MFSVELYARVRHACHVEALLISTREAARRFGLQRNTGVQVGASVAGEAGPVPGVERTDDVVTALGDREEQREQLGTDHDPGAQADLDEDGAGLETNHELERDHQDVKDRDVLLGRGSRPG
jgi:hypothetical protein